MSPRFWGRFKRITGTQWVLKMHGDIREPGSIVLTRSDFVSYDAKSRPLGSIVQSLMMTKHLLVVGASMTDDNFLRLAHEVFAFHEAGANEAGRVETHSTIGTVLTLVNVPAKARLWEDRFTYLPISNEATRPDQARDLTILLDRVAMLTSTSARLNLSRAGTLAVFEVIMMEGKRSPSRAHLPVLHGTHSSCKLGR
jgi:hypothetical protein